MHTNIQPAIKANPELSSAVERATEHLEAKVRASWEPVSADWVLVQDEHTRRKIVGLKLSDLTGAVEARFTPEELHNADRMEARLSRIWGDLLQVRSGKQIAKLKHLLEQLEGD